jgi:F-type H+-transporting ATPase subunit delta
MREPTIVRNYAETLVELARRADDLAGWGELVQGVADAMQQDRTLRSFMETPRIGAPEKNRLLAKAFEGQLPPVFVRFLQALVSNRRQMLIPEIALDYHDLVDEAEGRIHANVTVALETDDGERSAIVSELSRAFGKQVVPHFVVNRALLGGLVVRVGDTVLDGSVRKRLATLRARMMA